MATTKAPGHIFYSDQTTNFFLAHLIGVIASTSVTFIIWLIITVNILDSLGIYTLLIFALCEYFVYAAIEATRKAVPPLHYVPITWNGKFYGKLAGAGSYVSPYPFGLIFTEMMNEEPKFFVTPEVQISSKANEKLKGGAATVSYNIDFSDGIKFTKNVQENFQKRMSEIIRQEEITLVSNSVFSDPNSSLREGLEQICKDMKNPPQESKYEDVQKLCKESGVILNSINIAEFNFEDEEDKDAAAQLQRQLNKNKGALSEAKLIAEQMNEIKKAFQESNLTFTESDIKDMWEQKFGGKQKIDITSSGGGSGGNGANVIIMPPSK